MRRGHKGGGIIGMQTRFDYLVDSGAGARRLDPIFQSAANQGHHAHDDFRVVPVPGDNQAFR